MMELEGLFGFGQQDLMRREKWRELQLSLSLSTTAIDGEERERLKLFF